MLLAEYSKKSYFVKENPFDIAQSKKHIAYKNCVDFMSSFHSHARFRSPKMRKHKLPFKSILSCKWDTDWRYTVYPRALWSEFFSSTFVQGLFAGFGRTLYNYSYVCFIHLFFAFIHLAIRSAQSRSDFVVLVVLSKMAPKLAGFAAFCSMSNKIGQYFRVGSTNFLMGKSNDQLYKGVAETALFMELSTHALS